MRVRLQIFYYGDFSEMYLVASFHPVQHLSVAVELFAVSTHFGKAALR